MNKHKYIPKIGEKYGKLTIISYNIKKKNKKNIYFVFCECDCGKIIETQYYNLRTQTTKSCGCIQKTNIYKAIKTNYIHGMSNTRLFNIWNDIKKRCYNTKAKSYIRYGGRNIIVCEEWKNNFLTFYNWAITNGYQEHLTIDRKDNNGNYEPSNCRWVNQQIQCNNKNNNVLITAFGETKTVEQWTKDTRCKVKSPQTLISRIKLTKNKLTSEEILTIIPQAGNKNLQNLIINTHTKNKDQIVS